MMDDWTYLLDDAVEDTEPRTNWNLTTSVHEQGNLLVSSSKKNAQIAQKIAPLT